MSDTFAVHLGGGVYLDANGKLTSGKPEGALAFPATEHKLDAEELTAAVKELAELTGPEAIEQFEEWGADPELLEAFGIIGGVTGVIAGMLGGIGVAMALMKAFGWLSGNEKLSPAMASVLSTIRGQLQGAEEIARADKLIDLHSDIDGPFDVFKKKVSDLAVHMPTGAAKLALINELREIVDALAQPLNRLGSENWLSTYVVDEYKVRFALSGILRFGQPDAPAAWVGAAPPGATRFDHRFGVPMLLYAGTVYATMLHISTPWFRSSGSYAGQLRKFAGAIDRFIARMQGESLAFTEHTPQSLFNYDVNTAWLGMVPLLIAGQYPKTPGPPVGQGVYPVGAFDLVRFNDALLNAKALDAFVAGADVTRIATFDFAWDAPAGMSQAVADAANAQARRDYADLLLVNGVLPLTHMSALLRYLSTPPDRSETVAGAVRATRLLDSEEPATARSPFFLHGGVVEKPATLQKYRAYARLRATTQEPGHAPAFQYRVVLRTIDSRFGKDAWARPEYVGSVWRAEHEKLAGDPNNMRLRTYFSQGAVLSEVVLHEGVSPVQPLITPKKSVTMRAHTFDWYVPLLSKPWEQQAVDISDLQFAVPGAGGAPAPGQAGGMSPHLMGPSTALQTSAGIGPTPMQTFGGPRHAPLHSVVDVSMHPDIGLVAAEEMLDRGERRHVREESVTLDWQLSWKDGELDVIVSGQPQYRGVQVWIVVEEVVYSGEPLLENLSGSLANPALRETLHTAFAAEIVNQLMLVPKSFFDEERAAIAKESRAADEAKRRWAISSPPRPGDPIFDAAIKARERLGHSASTATIVEALTLQLEAFREHQPELYREVVASLNMREARARE